MINFVCLEDNLREYSQGRPVRVDPIEILKKCLGWRNKAPSDKTRMRTLYEIASLRHKGVISMWRDGRGDAWLAMAEDIPALRERGEGPFARDCTEIKIRAWKDRHGVETGGE